MKGPEGVGPLVIFGGQPIVVDRLEGDQLRRFTDACTAEALKAVKQARTPEGTPAPDFERRLAASVSWARPLKIALPDVITDELLERASPAEQVALIAAIARLSGIERVGHRSPEDIAAMADVLKVLRAGEEKVN